MQEAGKESPNSCPPVGTKFSPKMTDSVVKYAVIHLEKTVPCSSGWIFTVLCAALKSNAMPCHALKGSPFLK